MFVIQSNKHHSLSPNARLSVTGGQRRYVNHNVQTGETTVIVEGRKPGEAANTAHATVLRRSEAYILQTPEGYRAIARLACTKSGRDMLLRLSYRTARSVARRQLGYTSSRAHNLARRAMGRTREELRQRAATLRQRGRMNDPSGPKYDRTDPRESFFHKGPAIGFGGTNWYNSGPAYPTSANSHPVTEMVGSILHPAPADYTPVSSRPTCDINIVRYEADTGDTYLEPAYKV